MSPKAAANGRAVVIRDGRVPPPTTTTTTTTTTTSTTTTTTTTTTTVPVTTTTSPVAPSLTTSTNWSGYVLPSSSILTEVSGEWTVPSLNCADTPNGDAATWVGIGGESWPTGGSSGALLQTGIDSRCVGGAQQNAGFFELYPSIPNYSEVFSNFSVATGDTIVAEVDYGSSGWATFVEDLNTGLQGVFGVGVGWLVETIATHTVVGGLQGVATGTSYGGGYTGEWVVEDPTDVSTGSEYPFANFGTTTISDLGTDLSSWSLPSSDGWEIKQNGATLSVPSPVDGDSFSVNYTGS